MYVDTSVLKKASRDEADSSTAAQNRIMPPTVTIGSLLTAARRYALLVIATSVAVCYCTQKTYETSIYLLRYSNPITTMIMTMMIATNQNSGELRGRKAVYDSE